MGPSHPVGSAALFGINCFEPDSCASLFRNFPTGYLQRGVSLFPLDLDRQYTSLVKMDDLLLGEYELGDQVFCHPIFPLAVDAVVRDSTIFVRWNQLQKENDKDLLWLR